MELTDGVVLLRPFTLDDVPAHLAGEDDQMRHFLQHDHVSTPETVTAWIEANTQQWRTGGPRFAWALVQVDGDVLSGHIDANLAVLDFQAHVANISYSLHPHARGKRLMDRAVALVVGFLRTLPDVTMAVIQMMVDNHPSRRVAERCGFTYVGRRIDCDGDDVLAHTKSVTP